MKLPMLACLALCLPACGTSSDPANDPSQVHVAHLARQGGDAPAFARLRAALAARNPDYDVAWHPALRHLARGDDARVLFVQRGPAQAVLGDGHERRAASTIDAGDVVLLREGEQLDCDAAVDVLAFTTPEPPPPALPSFVRPDFDPMITDTPGGCATETGAYRRILLTWLRANGAYVWHALNAHRVRIDDSFTHYHPLAAGFDELYLVQGTRPGARLLVCSELDAILHPESLDAAHAASLLREIPLEQGDLVYLPRGVVHRGLGGVLAQVIAIPGFVPGSELGVDDRLQQINARLHLQGAQALPLHAEAATQPSGR